MTAAPPLRRRMASFVYEGLLLFGVVMAAGLVYSPLTQQRHALVGTWGLRAWIFCVVGVYFVYFWSRHGQTLPMRTWHIALVDRDGRRVSVARAAARYVLSWLWFLPALAAVGLSGLHGAGATSVIVAAGVAGYAGLVWLHPSRQFLHDVLCGTRLVVRDAKAVGQNPAA